MSTGVGCRLFIDGQRFADGCTGEPVGAPVALSGLKVTWGRESTVDQPDASTCDFQVADPLGGVRFTELLRTGLPVQVYAYGTDYPDPTVPVWPDPGFESGSAATITSNATATVTSDRAHTGTASLRLDASNASQRAGAIIAPAPFAAPNSEPDAWDGIPATADGQSWTVGASVLAPPGAALQLRAVLFSGPWRSAARVLAEPVLTATGTGEWQQLSAELVPDQPGAWVGVQVLTYPTGPTWAQMPPDQTWAELDPSWTWRDYGSTYVDDVAVLAPAGGLEISVLVFAGRIVALSSSWPDGELSPVVEVSCVDFTADLENRQIGDEPWPVESVGARFDRVLELAGGDVSADLDADLAAFLVTWRDVDAQAVTGLLVQLAESVDGVLWSATHATTGPYFQLEDPAKREPLYVLDEAGGVVVIVPNPGEGSLVRLSACDVLRDAVTWTQDVQDLITRAVVTWLEQGVNDEGEPTATERTVQRIDAALEASYGSRRLSLSSQLQAAADADAVALRLLARTSELDWRAAGLAIDDADLNGEADAVMLLTLLDGTSRNGAPLQVIDLPGWAPAQDVGVNLEGGSYAFDDGRWVLDLTVSNYGGQGKSARWLDLDPGWTWAQIDPAITWDDLRGVGVA